MSPLFRRGIKLLRLRVVFDLRCVGLSSLAFGPGFPAGRSRAFPVGNPLSTLCRRFSAHRNLRSTICFIQRKRWGEAKVPRQKAGELPSQPRAGTRIRG